MKNNSEWRFQMVDYQMIAWTAIVGAILVSVPSAMMLLRQPMPMEARRKRIVRAIRLFAFPGWAFIALSLFSAILAVMAR